MPLLRRPLSTVSPNIRAKGVELSPYLRGKIINEYQHTQSYAAVARKFDLSESTIRTTIKKDATRQDRHSIPRSGRPLLIDNRLSHRLIREVTVHPKTSFGELKHNLGFDFGRTTLRKHINTYRIK